MNDTGLETRFMPRAGQVIELRRAGDPSLPAPVQDGPSLREIVWGVDTEQALDTLAANLLTDRKVWTDAEGTVHAVDQPTPAAPEFPGPTGRAR